MRVASPGFLAALIVAAWAGFVAAAFFGLAVLPRWSLQQQVSAQEVALVSEAWWRSRRPDVAVPSLVWLAGPRCGCAGDAGLRQLSEEARQLGVKVLSLDALQGPDWAGTAVLPEGSAIDTLLFDANGQLRLAFLSSNPDHFASARARVRAGLAHAEGAVVWPGLCDCG